MPNIHSNGHTSHLHKLIIQINKFGICLVSSFCPFLLLIPLFSYSALISKINSLHDPAFYPLSLKLFYTSGSYNPVQDFFSISILPFHNFTSSHQSILNKALPLSFTYPCSLINTLLTNSKIIAIYLIKNRTLLIREHSASASTVNLKQLQNDFVLLSDYLAPIRLVPLNDGLRGFCRIQPEKRKEFNGLP